MSPIQQMLLGVGAVATKTYVDDVFSTYLWTGNATARSFNNGIDNTKGGLVWMKSRSNGLDNYLFDTERGVEKYLWSNTTAAEVTASSGDTLTAFNNNGFSIGNTTVVNNNNSTFAGWNFRKAPGFFTCLTYVGNGSNRTISHDLGCVPGMIILKNLDASDHWVVYHRGNADSNNAAHYSLRLNTTAAKADWFNYFQDTLPTATEFTLGTDSDSNGNGENFIAYLFAGGESTAATARSVGFDGSDDELTISGHADLAAGTSDYTWECWIKPDNWDHTNSRIYASDNQGFNVGHISSNFVVQVSAYNYISTTTFPEIGQWTHVAVTKQYVSSSNKSYIRLFFNGTLIQTYQDNGTINFPTANNTTIGNDQAQSAYDFDGKISNLRIVKGTALYTSSFRPPTEPLTNITNTKLLCCNNSSTTGSTVTPATISAAGGPTASTDSPFDDPAGFVFGDAGDQNVIKCGSYVGSGSAGLEVNVGWEPSWVLIKNSSTAKEWKMLDSMRGLPTGSGDNVLIANSNEAETGSLDNVDLTSTGFKLTSNNSHYNTDGDTYIYMCIRRPDGYVGKPPELGTDVFAMDTGNSSSTIPTFDSGFPVDMGLFRRPASSEDWTLINRLTGDMRLKTNTNAAEASSGSEYAFDSNTGFMAASWANTNYQAWMWKRHAGFDVVTITNYDSTAGPTYTWHPHSLGKKPEMIWVKRRDSSQEWWVYHHGANGGTNPWNNYLQLHSDAAEGTLTGFFGESGPTATTFSLKRGAMTDGDFIFMLFASVDGISKVGYYDGSSTSSFLTITTGFQPRFLMVKRINDSGPWLNVDTTRGWVNGDDKVNYFNLTAASEEYGMSYPTSTGFVLDVDASFNMANNKYIYYCHA